MLELRIFSLTTREIAASNCRDIEVGRKNFANKVVNEWNKLSAAVIECSTVGSFKFQLAMCNEMT